MAPTGSSVGTLVVFVLSILFVIHPVSFSVTVPYFGRRRIHANLTTAPIIAILVLWAAQCLGARVIRDGIVGTDGVKPYNILILFISLAYMAITLDITGVLQAAAFWVSNKGGSNGYKLYLYFYLMLSVLSIFLGNDPVILSGTAFMVYYTKVAELNPMPWLILEFAAANAPSMVLFVGNPTNVVICEGFRINNAAFTAYTIFPFLACFLFCFLALAFQFRKERYIPRHINSQGDLDVRSVLLDPISAWVGGILLGTCLIVIIVVSFIHIDVWMISLPFAVVKLIYDMAWDHHRYRQKIPGQYQGKKSDEVAIQPIGESVELENYDSTRAPSHVREGDSVVEGRDTQLSHRFDAGNISSPQTHVNTRAKIFETQETCAVSQVPGKQRTNRLRRLAQLYHSKRHEFTAHFPTLSTALPRLPFALVPFAFSQFILIEALAHQGWIDIFATWFVRATHRQVYPSIWLVGILGVILCNISGTNIGATILLTKIVRRAADSSFDSGPAGEPGSSPAAMSRASAVALAVASNIGAVSFTFSASLAGLLWRGILQQKGIFITQRRFAFWNILPLAAMTVAGLGVVCAEMAVLNR